MADKEPTEIKFNVLRHPDQEKDFQRYASTRQDISEARRNMRERCCNFECTEPTAGMKLRKCGKCHEAQYCSRECQVKDWKTHKQSCEPDPVRKLMNRVLANHHLTREILCLCVMRLKLLDPKCDRLSLTHDLVAVKVSQKPANLEDMYMAKWTNKLPESLEVMLQVESVDVLPYSSIHDQGKAQLELVRRTYDKAGDKNLPLVGVHITSNNVQSCFAVLPIGEEVFDHVRQARPLLYKSATKGTEVIPFSEKSVIEAINSHIRSDKKNQLMLRRTVTGEELQNVMNLV